MNNKGFECNSPNEVYDIHSQKGQVCGLLIANLFNGGENNPSSFPIFLYGIFMIPSIGRIFIPFEVIKYPFEVW